MTEQQTPATPAQPANTPASKSDQRADLERLEGLLARATTPARRTMLAKRISRLRKRIGRR